ncbi:predicted protein [Phaeodactylum tricornutum CCAP 1055/1]|jgi:hypothetical protein|uniref:Glycoside hydrolase 131 catalytic N-terminal domain-containing protein n=1 Tax=Phaeodactylum tricornutum (strain CCAP 1055/1) TaxID=556484 RepID=B7G048_PHATC|nr:predicted protein [Phaeodactylum tricornutum CCAP 1055/1]EEC48023.1 predicted protein [Phaeodactylum tricornutum CCAP 1055/1]|eukprot:XP_002180615.1 predicted protein [Phaeodactylum tricornutum CCAP 1055/1]
MKFTAPNVALFLLAALQATATSVHATRFCKEHGALIPVTVVSATSPDADGLKDGFEVFRDLLGGENNGNGAAPSAEGHRQVNWDAPIVPFDMPGDFFATTVDRGLNLRSKRDEFRVSNPDPKDGPKDDLFDSISPRAAKDFQTFSAFRLFTVAGGDNEFVAEFTVPGSHKEATVAGFGAVLVDVDLSHKTTLTFYADSGCIIAQEDAKALKDGLSFVGLVSQSEKFPIAKVEVELGNKAIDDTSRFRGFADFVVMDDFLYSEPQELH